MLSRALSLATVTLVVGCLTAVAVRAVENLEAGKTPSQIFAGTCNACHKSPRGLLRSVPASSLSGFLRQHYTTSSDMANVLAGFLVSNGAADTRFQAKDQPKQGKDGAKDTRQEAATRPANQPDQPDSNRNARQRLPRPGETPDVMRPDHGPVDAKQGLKQRQGKKGRPAEEPPKAEEPAKTEPSTEAPKTETAKGDDSARPEGKSETGKSETVKSETAKVDAPKESVGEPPATRPDPVPAVTPAPPATAAAPSSTTASGAPAEAAGSSPPAQAAQPAAPSAVAAAPALPPVPPAGPPVPPISQ
jgi:hypothetical protein